MLTPSILHQPAELPVLRLGLAGFTAAEQSLLNIVLASRAAHGQISWQLAALGEADAWCVNGSRVQCQADGVLRILPGLPSGRSIRIHPDEIDWPIAFSTPLGSPEFEPAFAFEADSLESMESMLQHLEGWLRPLMVQFYLARHIVDEQLDLRTGVFHVSVHGKLYAMVSQRSGIGVWPIANPADLGHAVWSHRPDAAADIPNSFVRTDYSQLMWQYATRTTRDCLPPHYRNKLLYLRRPPRVPMRLLNDPSLLLVRELGYMPGTFSDLAQRTGIAGAQLARHLGALYMVGAITADPRRAPAPKVVVEGADWHSSFPSGASVQSECDAEMTVKLTISSASVQRPRSLNWTEER
jgi:hypothetical protein